MAGRAFVSRFSPNRTDPEVLEAIFVQRHRLAEIWLERLRDSVLTGTQHHLLAVGPRGCGKSHLVVLLLHRLRQDPAVMERARVAWLPEDETTPSFWKFLLRILRALHAEYGEAFPPPPREHLSRADDAQRAAVLTRYLLEKLDGRVLLVVVENLDDVMRGLGVEGQRRWRAFLQENRTAATLATAQQLTKDLSSRDRPFFNFFQIEHLQPLTADEALSLLRKLADQSGNTRLSQFLQTPAGRARVRAIRHLTGGSHRVFIILSEFATRENLDNLVSAFEELLDELTPYYQERLRWLPDQQREIVEFLCRQNRTVQVKEIAAELFLTEQTAAAQLKGLRDKRYVTAASVGRESRYELAEPLMRLCVEVKDPQRKPMRLIVEFLRVWYDQADVEFRLECLPEHAHLERDYFRAVLREFKISGSNPLEEAMERDLEAARTNNDPEVLAQVLTDLAATADQCSRCSEFGHELYLMGRHNEAIAAYNRALEFDDNDAITRISKGWALIELDRLGEALQEFNRSLEFEKNEVGAWAGKGYVLHHTGQYSEALGVFNRALEIEPENPIFMRWIGSTLNWLGRFPEALSILDRSLTLDPSNDAAWSSKGCALRITGNLSEALESYNRAIEIQPCYAPSWSGKASIHTSSHQFEDAIVAYGRAIQIEPDQAGYYRDRGYCNIFTGRISEAIKDFDRSLDLDRSLPGASEGLAEAYLLLGDWPSVEEVLSENSRRPYYNGETAGWYSTFLTLLYRGTPDTALLAKRVIRLAELAQEAEQDRNREQSAVVDEMDLGNSEIIVWVKPVTLLGEALVRSLKDEMYAKSNLEAVRGWSAAWRAAAAQHPDLALSVRLFEVGLRYVRTQDERVLLDLVQEERAILRDLFGLGCDYLVR